MELKNKKILVTGGHGFLGHYVIEELLTRGVSREDIFAPTAKELDLTKRENCESAVRGIDVVIHAAAMTGNALLHRDCPADIFYINMIMGVELMEAARKAAVSKFVSIGSATEYPETAKTPLREEDLWAGKPALSHAPYAWAKKMLLVQAEAYRAQYDFNAVHLLFTNMYGPRERSEGGPIPTLIQKMCKAMEEGVDFIEAWGTGAATRDFLYVKDAAEAVALTVEKYDAVTPLNIGSGHETSIRELADVLKKLTGFGGEIRWDVTKPEGPIRRFLDTARAREEIGFSARTSLESGLKDTIQWHLKK